MAHRTLNPILSHIYGTWQATTSNKKHRIYLSFTNRFDCLPQIHRVLPFYPSAKVSCGIADIRETDEWVKTFIDVGEMWSEFRCIVLNWMQHFCNLLPSVRHFFLLFSLHFGIEWETLSQLTIKHALKSGCLRWQRYQDVYTVERWKYHCTTGLNRIHIISHACYCTAQAIAHRCKNGIEAQIKWL